MLHIADISNPPTVESVYSFPLDPFQQCAFKAIHNHEHVLVTAKTGSGKTLIGEEQVRVSLAKGKRCFYTTPIKSLSNQKFNDFKKLGHSVGILTGDIKFAPQSPLVVMTTELLCNLLFKKDTPNQSLIDLSLDDVDSIIFDEVHYINDPDRGKVWEQCLMMLPPSINMVMLSATIADADKFGTWLAKTKNAPVHLISTQYRVVPLIHMVGAEVVLDSKDKFHPEAYTKWLQSITDARKKEREHEKKVATRRRGGYDDVVVTKEHRTVSFLQRMNELIDKLDGNTLLPALFFVFSRNKCEEYAQKVTSDLLDSSDVASVKHILSFHLHKYKYIETSPQYHKLARLLEKGVAFHHSGLLPVLKEIVEILFSKGFVKVLFATETFAVGINMPTKTVVFTSYQKHDAHGYRMLRSDEYIQMAGRAGRRGKDTEGLVLYLPDREAASLEEVQKMMNGQQQRVSSKMDFGYDFLIKTFYGNAINWKDILEKSYWFQQRQESIGVLQRDLKRKEEVRDTLQISPEIVEELWVREGIDARIQNGANAGRKKALREMESWKGEHIEAKWEIAWKSFGRWKEVCKEIAILQSTIEDLQTVDPLIQPRIAYLKHHQYLDGDVGRLAANIHEGHPLLLPLAFRKRVFHGLSREQLVGCLSLFADGEGNVSFSDVSEIDDTAIDAVLKLQTLSEELQEGEPIASPESYWSLSYYWYDVVVRWMRGENLSAICQSYQIHEGNAVRALLKVSNLADEWITMATLAGDTEQLELLKDIRAQLVRDSVVPDSLYLHI